MRAGVAARSLLALAACWKAPPPDAALTPHAPYEVIARLRDGVAGDCAIDDTHVYMLSGNDQRQTGGVYRVAKTLGARPELFADASGLPTSLGLDREHVYWGEDDAVRFAAKVDGEPRTRLKVPGVVFGFFHVEHELVVGYEDEHGRPRAARLTGAAIPLGDIAGSTTVMMGGLDALYVATRDGLHRVDREGFVVQLVEVGGVRVLAFDDKYGYAGDFDGVLRRFNRHGRIEQYADSYGMPMSIAIDDRRVYWTISNRGEHTIYEQDNKTGRRRVVIEWDWTPKRLLRDGAYLYWCDDGGYIIRMSVDR